MQGVNCLYKCPEGLSTVNLHMMGLDVPYQINWDFNITRTLSELRCARPRTKHTFLFPCTVYIIFSYKNCRLCCTKNLLIFIQWTLNLSKMAKNIKIRIFLVYFKNRFCYGFRRLCEKDYTIFTICMLSLLFLGMVVEV